MCLSIIAANSIRDDHTGLRAIVKGPVKRVPRDQFGANSCTVAVLHGARYEIREANARCEMVELGGGVEKRSRLSERIGPAGPKLGTKHP